MSILAYLRASTDRQDLDHQKLEILEYGRRNDLRIDAFIAITMSSRKSRRDRRIDDLLDKLQEGDTLIVTELSRLGRSTGEVISLIDELLNNQITIIIIKQNLQLDQHQDDIQSLTMITMLSLFAQLERTMISRRTKEALAAKKARGVRLGKPKGTIQKSMFDPDRDRIVELLSWGVSIPKIAAAHLKYGHRASLHRYIVSRNLRDAADRLKADRP
jgi:DNA invertase Pin-like site-specific DNA recombinase